MWDILNIAPTHDQRAIKRAYSSQLKNHHPEEDPEGFQQLRLAYETALEYARCEADSQTTPPTVHTLEEDANPESTDRSDEVSRPQQSPALELEALFFSALDTWFAEVACPAECPTEDLPTPADWSQFLAALKQHIFNHRQDAENQLCQVLTQESPVTEGSFLIQDLSPVFLRQLDEILHWSEENLHLSAYIEGPGLEYICHIFGHMQDLPSIRFMEAVEELLLVPYRAAQPLNWQSILLQATKLEGDDLLVAQNNLICTLSSLMSRKNTDRIMDTGLKAEWLAPMSIALAQNPKGLSDVGMMEKQLMGEKTQLEDDLQQAVWDIAFSDFARPLLPHITPLNRPAYHALFAAAKLLQSAETAGDAALWRPIYQEMLEIRKTDSKPLRQGMMGLFIQLCHRNNKRQYGDLGFPTAPWHCMDAFFGYSAGMGFQGSALEGWISESRDTKLMQEMHVTPEPDYQDPFRRHLADLVPLKSEHADPIIYEFLDLLERSGTDQNPEDWTGFFERFKSLHRKEKKIARIETLKIMQKHLSDAQSPPAFSPELVKAINRHLKWPQRLTKDGRLKGKLLRKSGNLFSIALRIVLFIFAIRLIFKYLFD